MDVTVSALSFLLVFSGGVGLSSSGGLEDLYLDVRYYCMALRVAARRAGMGELASALKKAVDDLCLELRRVLAGEGRDVVSRRFDPSLLGRPLEELFEACRGAAERLVEATGSRAGARILEVLDGYGGVAGGGRGG